ncbi:hypothetical protein TNCV_2215081 [Trichonephila clavipes]|nr:hypothetical protein TNCV_2215081 [Trichonephila clavipes]
MTDTHCSATIWFLTTDLVTLNHGQVTRTTPKLAPSSPNFHTTLTEGRLSIDRINVHWIPLVGQSSAARSHDISHKSVTLTTGLPQPCLMSPIITASLYSYIALFPYPNQMGTYELKSNEKRI